VGILVFALPRSSSSAHSAKDAASMNNITHADTFFRLLCYTQKTPQNHLNFRQQPTKNPTLNFFSFFYSLFEKHLYIASAF